MTASTSSSNTAAYLLYVDHPGHPAPLTECFHATASRRLSSTLEDRFPPSTWTEVDSAYCPQCLSFYDASTAVRLQTCPKVTTCLHCPVCIGGSGGGGMTAVATVTAAHGKCYYHCGQCTWTSLQCDLWVPLEGSVGGGGEGGDGGETTPDGGGEVEISKLELTRAAEELAAAWQRRRQALPSSSSTSAAGGDSHAPDATASSLDDYLQRLLASSSSATSSSTLSGNVEEQQRRRTSRRSLSSQTRPEEAVSRTTLRKAQLDNTWSLEVLEASLQSKRQQYYQYPLDDFHNEEKEEENQNPAEGDGAGVAGGATTKTSSSSLSLQRLSLGPIGTADSDTSGGAPAVLPTAAEYYSTVSLDAWVWQSWVSPHSSVTNDSLLPLPIPLRARRSRRCRAELAEGRPGILIKPKLNPLEGDSSLRTGHGQWWRKDSSAVHVIPRVKVVQHAIVEAPTSEGTTAPVDQQHQYHVFLLKVVNPTLGTVRLRFSHSSYAGEPTWDEDDATSPTTSTTTTLSHLLVDTLTQKRFARVELSTAALSSLPATDVVGLLSAEDSIIEMGGRARDIPESVAQWQAAQAVDAAQAQTARMRLVAHCASDAWFELIVPAASLTTNGVDGVQVHPAFPLLLQVELGNGSWESSLIPPKTTNTSPRADGTGGGDALLDHGDDAKDWVNFDLVLTW